jgi:hypothetical protein
MSITNGSITIEDGLKAAEEYAPARKVSVTLAFANDDPLVDALAAAAEVANAKVTEMLGRPKATPAMRKAPAAGTAHSVIAKKADKDKTKDDLAREMGLPTTGGEGLLDETPAPSKPAAAPKPDTNELDDIMGADAPAPVTDAELAHAAQKKNATEKESNKTWAPAKIRDLVTEFAGAGKQLRDIPAEKRQAFLVKLEALK